MSKNSSNVTFVYFINGKRVQMNVFLSIMQVSKETIHHHTADVSKSFSGNMYNKIHNFARKDFVSAQSRTGVEFLLLLSELRGLTCFSGHGSSEE